VVHDAEWKLNIDSELGWRIDLEDVYLDPEQAAQSSSEHQPIAGLQGRRMRRPDTELRSAPARERSGIGYQSPHAGDRHVDNISRTSDDRHRANLVSSKAESEPSQYWNVAQSNDCRRQRRTNQPILARRVPPMQAKHERRRHEIRAVHHERDMRERVLALT
jgi:hypothetical protein